MQHPQPEPISAGQESVWDYPRPPRVERVDRRVRIVLGGEVIVDTTDVVRVLETSHPPVYYLLRDTFLPGALTRGPGGSACEFKGSAQYYDVRAGGEERPHAAWGYPNPLPGYEALSDRVAVYPAMMDRCTVDGIEVTPQPGRFYGGWITPEIRGPFKGGVGTMGW